MFKIVLTVNPLSFDVDGNYFVEVTYKNSGSDVPGTITTDTRVLFVEGTFYGYNEIWSSKLINIFHFFIFFKLRI